MASSNNVTPGGPIRGDSTSRVLDGRARFLAARNKAEAAETARSITSRTVEPVFDPPPVIGNHSSNEI